VKRHQDGRSHRHYSVTRYYQNQDRGHGSQPSPDRGPEPLGQTESHESLPIGDSGIGNHPTASPTDSQWFPAQEEH
jgi:hypothetical protein